MAGNANSPAANRAAAATEFAAKYSRPGKNCPDLDAWVELFQPTRRYAWWVRSKAIVAVGRCEDASGIAYVAVRGVRRPLLVTDVGATTLLESFGVEPPGRCSVCAALVEPGLTACPGCVGCYDPPEIVA
jgi:hypothetical protein